MITLNYCVIDGKYIGYIFFNNEHIFSSASSVDKMKMNMRNQIYVKHRVNVSLKTFELQQVTREEIPFAHMHAGAYKRIFARKGVRYSKHPKCPKDDALPTFEPKVEESADENTYIHEVKDGVLYVCKVVAKYKLAQ